jgi:polysaccharide deacetylase family protein (PEP-CTERM system associated)
MLAVTVTLDVEDHLGRYEPAGRYVDNTRRILAFLRERGVRATCFVVGRIAEGTPWLVREMVQAGHEIACHSLAHVPLDRETPASFRADTRRAKEALEQAGGVPVAGYRAPVFSLTPRTRWAVDELAALGFGYSSSVLPARHPLHGYPGAPRSPFAWDNGLVELPVPLAGVGPARLPFLGGIYLRYVPAWLVRHWARARPDDLLWTYLHPYDFDAEEPYTPLPGTAAWVSRLLWWNRKRTWTKLAGLIALGAGPPLGEIAADRAFTAALPRLAQQSPLD